MHDIIMRLGLKKVGVIAQQIILMNSLVKIKETSFDLRRFWEHSVGCALIADRLVTTGALPLQTVPKFSDYRLGTLLHDIGKFVMGLFFSRTSSKCWAILRPVAAKVVIFAKPRPRWVMWDCTRK